MKDAKKTRLGVLGGLALVAAAALAQTADRPQPAPAGERGPRCGERLTRALGLSAEQQASLDALRQETRDAIAPLMEQGKSIHDEVFAAASGTSPDACAIGARVVEGAGLHAQIENLRKAAEAKFVATLSADQKARYDSFVSINPGCSAVGGGFGPMMHPPR